MFNTIQFPLRQETHQNKTNKIFAFCKNVINEKVRKSVPDCSSVHTGTVFEQTTGLSLKYILCLYMHLFSESNYGKIEEENVSFYW